MTESDSWPGAAVWEEGARRSVSWNWSTRSVLVRFLQGEAPEAFSDRLAFSIAEEGFDFAVVIATGTASVAVPHVALWRLPPPKRSEILREYLAVRAVSARAQPVQPRRRPPRSPGEGADRAHRAGRLPGGARDAVRGDVRRSAHQRRALHPPGEEVRPAAGSRGRGDAPGALPAVPRGGAPQAGALPEALPAAPRGFRRARLAAVSRGAHTIARAAHRRAGGPPRPGGDAARVLRVLTRFLRVPPDPPTSCRCSAPRGPRRSARCSPPSRAAPSGSRTTPPCSSSRPWCSAACSPRAAAEGPSPWITSRSRRWRRPRRSPSASSSRRSTGRCSCGSACSCRP